MFILVVTQTANESTPTDFSTLSPATNSIAEPVPSKPDHPEVDIPALLGKRRTELSSVFPGLPPTDSGSSAKIDGWGGWKAAYLGFNGTGRLASISFNPMTPLSEAEAKRIVQETYGVSLPSSHEGRTPSLVTYHKMRGTIRTVNFSFVDWRTRDHRIGDIGIFFNLGWNE